MIEVKPKIIIQLSDEYKHENLEHHNDLSKYCDLMLRQYNHSEYRNLYFETPISNYKNLIHIPLGYLNDTKISRSEIVPWRTVTPSFSALRIFRRHCWLKPSKI